MGGGGSAPQPFNAQQSAQAQTASNIETATANAYLGAQSQYTPYGNLIYKETGQRKLGDGKNSIPEFQVHQELSPSQQGIFDQTQALQNRSLGLAGNVLDRVGNTINTPLNFDGLAELPTDQAAFRDEAYKALTARGTSDINNAADSRYTALRNQGIQEGSTAWQRGVEEFGRARNDLSNQSMINAGSLAGQNLSQAQTIRNQGINERLQIRNQPLLDYQSLLGLSGGVSQPQWAPPVQSQVAPTDVMSPSMFGYQQQMNAAGQQQSGNNAAMGGMMGLAGTGLMAGAMFM
jgi:hypothetical protein